jgi:hypothetical protein
LLCTENEYWPPAATTLTATGEMVNVAGAWMTVTVLEATRIVADLDRPVRLAAKLKGIWVPLPEAATCNQLALLVACQVAPAGVACTFTLAVPAAAAMLTVAGERTKDAGCWVNTALAFPTVTVAERASPVALARYE